MGENEKAIADLKKVLELKPDDAEAKTELKALEKKAAAPKAPRLPPNN